MQSGASFPRIVWSTRFDLDICGGPVGSDAYHEVRWRNLSYANSLIVRHRELSGFEDLNPRSLNRKLAELLDRGATILLVSRKGLAGAHALEEIDHGNATRRTDHRSVVQA